MKTNYELNYFQTCLSDYFTGSHKPVVQVPVDGTTTLENLKDMLLDYQATEHLEDLDTESYNQAVLDYFTSIWESGKWKTVEDMMEELWDGSLPVFENEEDYDEGCVYSYFILEELEGEEDGN